MFDYEYKYRQYRGGEIPKEDLDFDVYDWVVVFAPWMGWSSVPLERAVCICHEAFEMDGYNTRQYAKMFVTSDIGYEKMKHQENVVKVQAGIDLSIFNRSKDYKTLNLDNPVVGWVGAMSGHKEKKGYEEFYLPLGDHFTLKPHLKEKHYTENRADLVDYYHSIDVLVCTSSWEGYPMPILEATACGIPIVSTRVGIVPEVVPDDQIVERDVSSFVERIKRRQLKPGKIDGWQWENKIKEWEQHFV